MHVCVPHHAPRQSKCCIMGAENLQILLPSFKIHMTYSSCSLLHTESAVVPVLSVLLSDLLI